MAVKVAVVGTGAPAMVARVLNDLQMVPIDQVKLWKDNPRKNDKAVPRLMELLKIHGQKSPIIVWRKNGVCYKGNTTLKALRAMGAQMVKVQFEDFPTEAAAIAYGIADNKSSEWAEWDDDILKRLMTANTDGAGSFAPQLVGFTDKEMRGLMISEEVPEDLPVTDLIGNRAEQGHFIVVQFETAEQLDEFKEYVGMTKQERAIMYRDFSKFLA